MAHDGLMSDNYKHVVVSQLVQKTRLVPHNVPSHKK